MVEFNVKINIMFPAFSRSAIWHSFYLVIILNEIELLVEKEQAPSKISIAGNDDSLA